MKMLASLLIFGLCLAGLAALASCGFLQGAAAAVTGGSEKPPIAPGSTTELLYVGGYAVVREALGWFLRRRAATEVKT